MKNLYLIISISFLLCITAKGQTTASKDSTVYVSQDLSSSTVSGICSVCKIIFEKATLTEGVSSAKWDIETDILKVMFDLERTTLIRIRQSTANVGYDTYKNKAKAKTYDALVSLVNSTEKNKQL